MDFCHNFQAQIAAAASCFTFCASLNNYVYANTAGSYEMCYVQE